MAVSRGVTAALWTFAGLLAAFCFTFSAFHAPESAHPRQLRRAESYGQPVASVVPQAALIITKHSPGHQNPVVAPPKPLDQALKETALRNNGTDNASLNLDGFHDSLLARANTGPLYCNTGPCTDGSCCGKNNICGYGPDYCGDGCQSQCDATAMCGEYSENAEMPCGMNLCCSATGWCGTTEVYCNNADPLHDTLPCQAGYGSCQEYPTPSCAHGGGTTKSRAIGYYQSWNVRERKCNTVTPQQLDTSLYTHLFYAFASIDPNSFSIVHGHPDDEQQIPDFTALHQNGGPQVWIAVGGFDFSDETRPTHHTWSDLVSTKANRAAFISSVKAYMDKYGFQGIDLDWEYPGAPERGGRKLQDVRNFPLLLREMRAAFGTSYGISLTLAPDYWYARWFDAKAMEPHVDFFGFMAYDLHGSWDMDVRTLGKIVRGQADIREIATDTIPLWFDGLNPAKINFGLAMYGRGYTLADASCNTMGCSFAEASKPGVCTGFDGVLSLVEIKKLIKDKGWTSRYNSEALMKELVFEDQWIGYDDEETFAAKLAWADSRCFGGSMVWGIDYGVGATDDSEGNVVYLDTPIYSGTPAQCTPPCQFVLPPLTLAAPTTISIAPYTTSLEVAAGVTTTITVTINAITTTAIDFYNVNVTGSDGYTFTPAASIDLNPVTTTLTISGSTQVRTLTLPPWPAITQGPPGEWTTSIPVSTTSSGGDAPFPISFPDPTEIPITITSMFKTDFTPPGGWGEEPTSTTIPWPTFSIEPVETDVPESGEDDDGDGPESLSTCKLWFFWVCIDWPELDVHIHGWKWTIPPGVFGPGPPAIDLIKLPPGFEIKGTLPPWPRLTIPTAGPIPTPAKPASCSAADASLCYKTSSFGTTVTGGSTKTTATQVTSRCAPISDCNVRSTVTISRDACSLNWGARSVAMPTPTAAGDLLLPRQTIALRAAKPEWACDHDPKDAIVLLQDPRKAADREKIAKILKERDAAYVAANKAAPGFDEIGAPTLGSTGLNGFFLVKQLGVTGLAYLDSNEVPEIATAYYIGTRSVQLESDLSDDRNNDTNVLSARGLQKREMAGKSMADFWHLSQLSYEEDVDWFSKSDRHDPSDNWYAYFYDTSLGKGQTIYFIEQGMWKYKADGAEAGEIDRITRLPLSPGLEDSEEIDPNHGYYSAAFAAGTSMGVASEADLFWAQLSHKPEKAAESYLAALISIGMHMDKQENGQLVRPRNSIVVSMSMAYELDQTQRIWEHLRITMDMMAKSGVMFVCSAGNNNAPLSQHFPRNMARHLPGMMVVGAVDRDGVPFHGNGVGDEMTVLAPGVDMPKNPGPGRLGGGSLTGTSVAAPMVAGLAAYLRAHPFFGRYVEPIHIKTLIEQLRRPLSFGTARKGPDNMIYNGAYIVASWCAASSSKRFSRRQDGEFEMGGSCPVPGTPGGGNGDNGGNGGGIGPGGLTGPPVTFRPGTPGPLCLTNCGFRCDGYYCSPNPSGLPPDFKPPASTSPAVPSPTKTTINPIDPSALPTLTSVPTGGPIPSNCASVSTWSSCALGLPPDQSACQTFSDCGATFIDCATTNARPGDGINTGYCVCGGSTFPQLTATGANGRAQSCGYTSKPTVTTNPVNEPPKTTDTDACKVCSVVGHNNMECTTLANCTPQPTADPIPTGPASFYLYQVTVAGIDADVQSDGYAVSRKAPNLSENPGKNPHKHCDAVQAGTQLVDDNNRHIKADYPYYPWSEKSFKTRNGLCGKDLNFQKKGDDYDVYEGGKQVGVCTKAGDRSDSCFNLAYTTVTQIYACTGAC